MTTYVINPTDGQVPVEIEFPNDPSKVNCTVFIQPRSKAKIPSGSRVVPSYLQLNPEMIAKTIDPVGEPLISMSDEFQSPGN